MLVLRVSGYLFAHTSIGHLVCLHFRGSFAITTSIPGALRCLVLSYLVHSLSQSVAPVQESAVQEAAVQEAAVHEEFTYALNAEFVLMFRQAPSYRLTRSVQSSLSLASA